MVRIGITPLAKGKLKGHEKDFTRLANVEVNAFVFFKDSKEEELRSVSCTPDGSFALEIKTSEFKRLDVRERTSFVQLPQSIEHEGCRYELVGPRAYAVFPGNPCELNVTYKPAHPKSVLVLEYPGDDDARIEVWAVDGKEPLKIRELPDNSPGKLTIPMEKPGTYLVKYFVKGALIEEKKIETETESGTS